MASNLLVHNGLTTAPRGISVPHVGLRGNEPSKLSAGDTSAHIPRPSADAGRALAGELAAYRGKDNLLVLGLARGGVPVGREVASALHAELDAFLVRKLGVPRWSELAMGAVASGGVVVMNDNVKVASLHITDEQVREVIHSETAELQRREQAYRGGRAASPTHAARS